MAERIAGGHHERWDGQGYPKGLCGEEIPIEARIVALADVFDALCSPRSYKAAWTPHDALVHIFREKGHHFDPACVDAFERQWTKISAIMATHEDLSVKLRIAATPPLSKDQHSEPHPQYAGRGRS